MLAGEQDRLARLGAGDLQVRTAFEVSYQQLAEEDARLFRLLGLHPGPDLTTAAAAALIGMEPQAAVPALDRLTEAHLVGEDAAGRFVMHDLLRLFARATCQEMDSPADRAAAEARLVDAYAGLAKYLNSCLDPQRRPAAEQAAGLAGKPFPSLREALARLEAERGNLLAVVDLAARRGWDEQVVRLTERIGEWLALLHHLDDLLTVEKASLTAARHARDTAEEIQALNNLGIAYRRLRRFEEAVDCCQQALALKRQTGDRYGEG
jgi:tetratricopeptide (TPR) repeat protein